MSERCLKEAFEMTDMVKDLNMVMQVPEQGGAKVRIFKNAGAKVDIMKEFRMRSVFLGENGANEM